MKALLHYTPQLDISCEYVGIVRPSLERYGWDVQLVKALTPWDYDVYGRFPVMENSVLSKDSGVLKRTKWACSVNHYIFWQQVVTAGEPMAFLEHDVAAVRPPQDPEYEVEYLATSFIVPMMANGKRFMHSFKARTVGANPLVDARYNLKYPNDNPYLNGYYLPNTAAYVCTPEGAKKLIAAFEANGAERSDMQINTNVVEIGARSPTSFNYLTNPDTSSGKYWLAREVASE